MGGLTGNDSNTEIVFLILKFRLPAFQCPRVVFPILFGAFCAFKEG